MQNIHKYRESSCIKIIQRSDNYLTNNYPMFMHLHLNNKHAHDIITGAHIYAVRTAEVIVVVRCFITHSWAKSFWTLPQQWRGTSLPGQEVWNTCTWFLIIQPEILPFVALESSCRDGWRHQNGWIFGTSPKGVGFRCAFFKVCLVLISHNAIVENTHPESWNVTLLHPWWQQNSLSACPGVQ